MVLSSTPWHLQGHVLVAELCHWRLTHSQIAIPESRYLYLTLFVLNQAMLSEGPRWQPIMFPGASIALMALINPTQDTQPFIWTQKSYLSSYPAIYCHPEPYCRNAVPSPASHKGSGHTSQLCLLLLPDGSSRQRLDLTHPLLGWRCVSEPSFHLWLLA